MIMCLIPYFTCGLHGRMMVFHYYGKVHVKIYCMNSLNIKNPSATLAFFHMIFLLSEFFY